MKEKDGKKLQGGPYAEYIVLPYSDELLLRRDDVEQWLHPHVFQGLAQATAAYLLLSHDPAIDNYPFVKLPLGR